MNHVHTRIQHGALLLEHCIGRCALCARRRRFLFCRSFDSNLHRILPLFQGNYSSYTRVAQSYALVADSLPRPPGNTNTSLYVQIGNEVNLAWSCGCGTDQDPSCMSMDIVAAESAAFLRDSLSALRQVVYVCVTICIMFALGWCADIVFELSQMQIEMQNAEADSNSLLCFVFPVYCIAVAQCHGSSLRPPQSHR